MREATSYVLMALDDTKGPYRWPERAQWARMTRDERIACAERMIALARKRAWTKATLPTMAMRQAAALMVEAQRTESGDSERST